MLFQNEYKDSFEITFSFRILMEMCGKKKHDIQKYDIQNNSYISVYEWYIHKLE